MSAIPMYDHQLKALQRMKNGCILNGDVGSGKSRTALAYFYVRNGGDINSDTYMPMDDTEIKDLYIITTAQKRDKLEWEGELGVFLMSVHPEVSLYPMQKIVVDSWNNIHKYSAVTDAFFIFDEQRLVGSGAWVKAFLKIAKKNEWILLSATPGDTWLDYIPVFMANGFYHSRREFEEKHIMWDRYSKFPKVLRYINTGKLIALRNHILVDMEFDRRTVRHHEDVYLSYDKAKYLDIVRNRWNIWDEKPIRNASELCYSLRRTVNEDQSRQVAVLEIFEKHPKIIIFYNFDYELELLRSLHYGENVKIAEWNGHNHEPLPDGDKWVYLVQYAAGCEGWNCIKTDTIIFYSQTYSYKVMAQASGRIDRLNTPYTDLYYYHFKSRSGIDLAISKALNEKKKFNEKRWVDGKQSSNNVRSA